MQTASIGDSSTAAVGDEIAAIGNAGGRGGTPSIAAGTVSTLNQTITVTDGTGIAQRLTGMIQIAARWSIHHPQPRLPIVRCPSRDGRLLAIQKRAPEIR